MGHILDKPNRHLFLEKSDNTNNSFIANVNLVANNVENLDALVDNIEDVKTVSDNIDSVSSIGKNIDDINNVSDNIDDVINVSANINSIDITADNITSIKGIGNNIDTLLNLDAMIHIGSNPEFIRYYEDKDGRFLWGIRTDGSIEWGDVYRTSKEEHSSYTKPIVIVIAGQSNAVGSSVDKGEISVSGCSYWNAVLKQWMNPVADPVWPSVGGGFVPSLVQHLHEYDNRPIYIINVAVSGTYLIDIPNNTETSWDTTGTLRSRAVNIINEALHSMHMQYDLLGTIWYQGEFDAVAIADNKETIEQYTDGLDSIALWFMKTIGGRFMPIPIAPRPTTRYASAIAKVNKAISNLPRTYSECSIASTATSNFTGQFLHLTVSEYETLGEDIAENIKGFYPVKTQIPSSDVNKPIHDIPTPIKQYIANLGINIRTDYKPYLFLIEDVDNRLLFAITKAGDIIWGSGVPEPVKEWAIQTFGITEEITSEIIKAVVDKDNRALTQITKDGKIVINSDVQLNGLLESASLPKTSDWSKASSLEIAEPRCAKVNFIGLSYVPLTKGQKRDCVMEFWDMQGNYFKKNVVAEPQGRSSLVHPKKNIAIDIEDLKLRIGDWVEQDSFHLKAYWNEPLRCTNPVCYKLFDAIKTSRGNDKNREWKVALEVNNDPYVKYMDKSSKFDLRFDTGARGFPDGFPCIVYMDNVFYGVYAWQLKKHKKNVHMKSDSGKHVYLEGTITKGTILGGCTVIDDTSSDPEEHTIVPTIAWNMAEIRNPKDYLYCITPAANEKYKYDFDDNPAELIDTDISEPLKTKIKKEFKKAYKKEHKDLSDEELNAKVDEEFPDILAYNEQTKKTLYKLNKNVYVLEYLNNKYLEDPTAANLEAIKTKFKKYYDLDNVIDYAILDDIEGQGDSFGNNTHWMTWDGGKKWFVSPYDMDISFGWAWTNPMLNSDKPKVVKGGYVKDIWTTHKEVPSSYPSYYVYRYFQKELNARWKFLRDAGIIDVDYIASLIFDWHNRVGYNNLELDHERWCADNFGMGSTILNETYWGWPLGTNNKPIIEYDIADNIQSTEMFSITESYSVGDIVYYGLTDASGYYKFECKKACTGILPVIKLNYEESIYRVRGWIKGQIESLDTLYCYEN